MHRVYTLNADPLVADQYGNRNQDQIINQKILKANLYNKSLDDNNNKLIEKLKGKDPK